MTASAHKQVEVQIMDQTYRLACPAQGEEALRLAVAKVDSAMCRIRDAGKVKARDRIAVLAALQIAFDASCQDASPSMSRPSSSGVPEAAHSTTGDAGATSPLPADAENTLRALVARIDAVLAADNRLL